MFRKLCAVLAVIGVGALWTASATAGCKNIGGTLYCAAWITGSEVQLSTVTGLGNIKDTCINGVPVVPNGCPVITAIVFGTDGNGDTSACQPTIGTDGSVTQDPTCAIAGLAYCLNPAGNSSRANGQPFSLDATLSNTGILTSGDCRRNGKCTETVEVELTGFNPCINPNWNFISFIASEFYGVSVLDYVDNQGQNQRIIIVDFCNANLPNSFKPGQAYNCSQQN